MKETDNYQEQKTCSTCKHLSFNDGVYLCMESKPTLPSKFIGYGQIHLQFDHLIVFSNGTCDKHASILNRSTAH